MGSQQSERISGGRRPVLEPMIEDQATRTDGIAEVIRLERSRR